MSAATRPATSPMKPPLLLLPGLLADDWSWSHQARHLADQAEVAVVDLHPCSSCAEMVGRVLTAAPGPFALAGHSMGGWAALAVAARAPERVSLLALVSTWAPTSPPAESGLLYGPARGNSRTLLVENLALILHPDGLDDVALVTPLLDMQRRAGRETLLRNVQALRARAEPVWPMG
jgi:pimeloyl-ACP methyl ester carboxylesterase